MDRSIFDTVTGQSVPNSEKPSLLDSVTSGREDLITGNPQAAGRFGVGESKLDWGIKESDIPNLQDIRAAHQSVGEQFLAFANQATVGQIVGAGIEGIGYLGDIKTYANLVTGTEKDFGNWFSDIGKRLQTWTEEVTPIYTDPDQAKFAPNHWSWWMQNGKSVTSTLSLMIPAVGVMKGLTGAAKLVGLWQKLSPTMKWAATGLTEAAISRHMESMQNAAGVYKESYTAGIGKGMSDIDAKEYAAHAASHDYGLEWAMYLQDVPQYLLLNRAFGVGKGTIGKLADRSLTAEKALGHSLLPVVGSKAAAIGWDMLGEGFEEGYQYIIQEESKYLEDKLRDPKTDSSFGTRLNKYLKDGDFWTNAAMGALGAGVMQTAGKAINDVIQGGDSKTRFVKEFGAKVSQASQAVYFADLLGSESGKRSAITNLETTMFNHAMATDSMDDAKELIKRTSNPNDPILAELGVKPEDLETLQLNREEILKHADEFEKRWTENAKKYDIEKAARVTNEEFLIDTFNGYKQDYSSRLSQLKDNITNFNSLSFEAQDMFGISSQILANQKRIDFQKKRLEDTKNPLEKKQIEQVNKLITSTEKTNARLKGDLKTLDESRDEETRKADDDLNIGGPYNLLNTTSDKDISGHAILEYKKLDEALAFADETLKSSQARLKEILTGKKEEPVKPIDNEDLNRIPESDDYVLYEADGKQQNGIVDSLDENGDYVIIPTTKWSAESKYATNPSGTPITVSKDKVVLDKKQYAEEDIHDESLGSDDTVIEINTDEDTSEKYLDIGYMHDGGSAIPVVDNEDLNRFLSNPKSSLDGVTAEMHIDTTSEFAVKYFKDKGFTDIEIRKITNGKYTDNDINELQVRLGSFDTIPIAILLVKDGKVLFKGGMFYHNTDFKAGKAPAYIVAQGTERTQRYLNDQKQKIRKNRFNIVPNLLKGNDVYSESLRRTNGHYNNSKERGNVLDRHGLTVADARLAVSRKNGKIYRDNSNVIPGVTSNTAGAIFAPTKKTINGKEAWAKIDPTKLTKEHAEILWDAILTRYSKGKGRLAAFPDDRVQGLSVGDVINMIALFGERKTNIDHENFRGEKREYLRAKTLFIHSGRDLTFGTTTVNIHEDDMKIDVANKEAFIKWATTNKNYSIPLGIKPMGVELNSPLKRTFKIGSWENKANEAGNFLTMAQFLMSVPVDGKKQFAVVSDVQEYEGTGSAFTRPNLLLGDNENAIKIRISEGKKPKVPKDTTKSKARKKTSTKIKKTQTIDSPFDIINLPIGAELYFMSPIVKEGVITEEMEPIVFATVEFYKTVGKVLNLKRFQSRHVQDTWGDFLELNDESSFKKADVFVSYLKSRPHIQKVLVDTSNVVEEKPQLSAAELDEIENEIKVEEYGKMAAQNNQLIQDTSVNVTDLTMPKSDETVDGLEDLLGIPGIPMLEFAEEVKSIVDLPKELAWFYKRFGVQNVKESDKLLTLAASGRKAFSVFTSDVLYIFTGAPEGALYHEAFHRVFLGYLSEEDRQRIYFSYRKQFKYDMDDNTVSERLAEDFRAYKLNGTKPKSRSIWQFFKDLYNFIVTYFTGQTSLTSNEIDRLYDSINRGQYRYSKITADNRRRLEGIETPMAVEIRKTTINIISNYRELDKIVKFLTSTLIITNEIDNLNDVKNIKMSKMWDQINVISDRLNNMINNTQKQLDDNLIPKDQIDDKMSRMQVSTNLLNILNLVKSDEYSPLFVDKISDQLIKLNVKRIQDEENTLDNTVNNNYKPDWDKASYEINSKDNILASVKFLVATLRKSNTLDPHIGIPEFVDFNEMWNSLMHNLYDINDVEEMMDRLNAFSDKDAYKDLISKLNADLTGVKKQQLRTAVQKHRHNFINFLLTVAKDGVPTIEITNADVSKASKRVITDWNLFFYGSKKLVDIGAEGIIIHEEGVNNIFNDYTTLSTKVEKEYSKNKVFADRQGIIESFVSLLKRIGIDVDVLSVEELIDKRVAENKDDALFQIIVSDFNYIFTKVRDAKNHDVRIMFNDEKYPRSLAEAYVQTHPELISDMILGPSNNQYYVYSQNSYVSDKIRKIRTDKTYLEEHLNKVYNDNSYYGQQLLADDVVRKGLEVMTFAMFSERRGTGSDYLDINPIEDYIFKLTAMANGIIPFPTMADRKTYYLLKGVQPLEFNYTANNDGTYTMPEKAIDILLGYAKSERNRIIRAQETIDNYKAAVESGNEEQIKQLEKSLVENYHYKIKAGKKLFDKENASALSYHNFPSFNREGFNFDTEARDEVRKSITNNVREELEYAESLGIIGSTVNLGTGKKQYYNRLLDTTIIKKGTEDYGSADMAIKNAIASFFVNTVIANNEVEKLFSGDPAFYKQDKDTHRVTEDKVKRLAVLSSTGDNFANNVVEANLMDSTFNVVTLATQKYQSVYYNELHDWHIDIQKRRLKTDNPDMSDSDIETKAKAIATDTLKAYREMDPTDGQAWISPEMYKSLSQRLGEWSKEKLIAFDLLQSGKELTLEEEKQVLNVTFQPLKLVYFDLLHDGNLAIPTYHKASFATIFRTITKGKYGDRQIAEMLDRMEGKGKYTDSRLEKVDMFVMDSATKVGTRSKFNVLDENLEEFNDLSKVDVYKQAFSGLRRQLVTDAHDVDRTKTGTQFLKIVLGNLNLDNEVYTIDGKNVNGKYIRDAVFNALDSLSNRGRQELEKKLGYQNGKIDKKKLVALLVEDAKKSNASDNLIDAISMMGDDMYLELDALTDRKWIQSRIISLISKHTVDVNLPGNQLIQFANFGIRSINKSYTFEEELKGADKHISWVKNVTDDLKWMRLENGKVVPMGCIVSVNLFKHIIPHYNEISYADKVKYLSDNPEILGYRIPTQGQNSVFMLKIAGIYPETIGDTITLPSEFTALTGSDFDIDKAYVVRYNYIVKGNKFEKVKFIDGDTNDETVLKQIYKFRYGKLLGLLKYLEKKSEGENLTEEEIDNLSQTVELTDDKAVEDAIIKMRTRNKYDFDSLNSVRESVKFIPTEEEFVKNNKGKNIYDINSRKAVENRLLDSFFAVMRSEEHFDSTSTPLESLTEKLKKKAQKMRAVSEVDRLNMYYQSPRFNESVKLKYNGGKDGIGPFALNNVHHILAQLAGLEMRGSFGDVMYKGTGGNNIDLSRKRGKDDILISNWLSALIDAHVDVAKDPYIMDLNVNSFTYNVVALLLRGGVGETTFDFLAQPILRELANETLLSDDRNNVLTKTLRIEDGLDEEGQPQYKYVNALDYVKKKWSSKLTEVELEDINKLSVQDAFGDNLNSDLFTTDVEDKNFIKRQILVLKAFTDLKEMGNNLSTLIQASQIDTKKFGSNITELRVFINKIRKAYDINKFINIEKILPYNPDTGEVLKGDGANFLGTYAANAIKFSLNVMSDVSIYATPVFEEIFNKIIKVSGNEFTTDPKFVNVLSDEIFSAMVSKFFTDPNYVGIDSKKLSVLLDAVAQKLSKIKRNEDGVYDDIKDNIFLNYIYLMPPSDELIKTIIPMFVTVPMKSTKDKADKDNMINSFKELLKNDKPEVSGLARQLFYYAFFTSGYRSRIYSFFNLLPNEMFREVTIKDPTNPQSMIKKSYNSLIKQILEETKNPMNVLLYSSIVDEVLHNNHDHNNLVKLVKDNGLENAIYEYKGKKYDRPIAVILKNQIAARYLLGWNGDKPIYRPLIKIHDGELGHITLKYIGVLQTENEETATFTNEEIKDANSKGQNIVRKYTFKPIYVTQNMRSYNARGVVVKEYGMDKSIIPVYNELNVIIPAIEEEFMIHLSDGKDYKYVSKSEQLILNDQPETNENEEQNEGLKISGFQGYKGGFEDIGKGTPEGDGKDKAMRKDADSFIGEFVRNNSSTYTSGTVISDQNGSDLLQQGSTLTAISGDVEIIMLARNSEFKNKPITDITKENILKMFNKYNPLFIVGDMPGVDSGFIDYLQEIGAKFTIYYSGNSSRINLEVNPPKQLTLFNENETVATSIYNKLGDKTVSENVEIVDKPYLYSDEQKKGNAIVAYKSTKMPESFENPFHTRTDKTTKENVIDFIDFVLNSNEPQAVWIREKAKSGEFKGKSIYYGNTKANKENQPSHATALDYLINKYDWSSKEDEYPFLTNTPGEQFSTEKQEVRDVVESMGIINWENVTPAQWKELKDAYKHCK